MINNNFVDLKIPTAGANITIISGGYIKIGKIVLLNIKIKTTSAISVNATLLSGLPAPNLNNSFGLFATDDTNAFINAIYKGGYSTVNTAQPIAENKNINIMGIYFSD